MQLNSSGDDLLYMGIDGGGSKCRATLVSSADELLGTGVAGPANPFQDEQQAFDSVMESARLALEDAGLAIEDSARVVAGVGLAGVNLPRFYDLVQQWEHPFKQMFLATDLHIACLGAHDGQDGAVMVAGTGSCGYSYVDGQSNIVGAHGFPFGDKGSGAWIGLEAIKAVLLASDGLGPMTSLDVLISRQLGIQTLDIIEEMAGAASNKYAKLTPLVFAAANEGDAVAVQIIERGAEYLNSVARKLLEANPPRLSLLGGVGKYIFPSLDPAIAARFEPPLHQPEYGAIYFARQEWDSLQNTGATVGS